MTEPSDVMFARGLDLFSSVVAQLDEQDWQRPSPCEGWRAIDVLGHLGTSIEMGISLMAGEQPTWPDVDPPGELVVGTPEAYWADLAERAHASFDHVDLDLVMDTPMGPRTVADRLAFPAIDLYVHAWDLAASAGLPFEVPDEAIEFGHAYLDGFPPEMMRGPGKAFGPELPAPEGATASEAFVAWTGRQAP